MEEPIHNSLDELFDKANLTKNERSIFFKYKKSANWLLRSKTQFYEPFFPKDTNFIKRLAILLLNLHSSNVTGAKVQFAKQMFSDKQTHNISENKTKNKITSRKNSNIIINTYFELDILSFFLKNNYTIQLASDKIKGQKIPEFTANKDGVKINVEAKKLEYDILTDNILGDRLTYGIHYKFSKEEIDKGLKRVLGQFKGSYDKAILKYLETKEDYFIIFLSTYYRVDYMGKYTVDFINSLRKEWKDKNYDRLIGIVLPDSTRTYFIKNEICDVNAIKLVEKMGINYYHNYSPELIED